MASGLPWESLPAIAALSAVALLIVTDPGWRHWRLTVPTLTVIAGGWSLHFVLLAPSFGQRRGQGQALAPVEQAVAIAALALCAAAILRVLLRRSGEPVHARGTPSTRAHSSHLPLIVGSMLTLVFLAWLSMPAMLLHSEQFGFELLTDLHRFPEPATYRPSWGQVSFVVLGAAVRLTAGQRNIRERNPIANNGFRLGGSRKQSNQQRRNDGDNAHSRLPGCGRLGSQGARSMPCGNRRRGYPDEARMP